MDCSGDHPAGGVPGQRAHQISRGDGRGRLKSASSGDTSGSIVFDEACISSIIPCALLPVRVKPDQLVSWRVFFDALSPSRQVRPPFKESSQDERRKAHRDGSPIPCVVIDQCAERAVVYFVTDAVAGARRTLGRHKTGGVPPKPPAATLVLSVPFILLGLRFVLPKGVAASFWPAVAAAALNVAHHVQGSGCEINASHTQGSGFEINASHTQGSGCETNASHTQGSGCETNASHTPLFTS